MNVKRPLNIALATSIALMSVGCNATNEQHETIVSPQRQQDMTSSDSNSTNRGDFTYGHNVHGQELPPSQSRYEITFTKFFISQANDWKLNYGIQVPDNSEYLFYAYNPAEKNYVKKCNGIKECAEKIKNISSTKPGDKVPLNLTISNVSDDVYLMVLEKDYDWNVLNQTPYVSDKSIKFVQCPDKHKLHGTHEKTCLKIPVQYLLDNRNSCLTMATYYRYDKICLSYEIEKQQKLHSEFQSNLRELSALSPLFKGENLVKFFKNDTSYNQEQKVELFDFSRLPEVPNKSVLSVTFYANGRKASGLPTKIAQPVVDDLSKNYPSGLWVINGTDGALAAYGADQLNEYPSSIRLRVKWPQGIKESINDWLQTPEKNTPSRPYHTLRLYYKKGKDIIAKPVTGLDDTVDIVNKTLTLPGRYTLGKHINKVEVELSGIFSLLESQVESQVSGTSIELEPKTKEKIQAKLDLPDGYKYECQAISKMVPKWFAAKEIRLQCPRLPKSLIEPDFVDGEVRLNASGKELFLRLRFEKQQEQTSLKDWRIGNTTITQSGTQGYMLVNARDLPEPKNGQLTLVPPKSAFSIFYLNEPITVELSDAQQDYLYTTKYVKQFGSSATIELDVPNPKERPIETFKNSKNPWTPEELTFLCDGSQSNTTLCGKTCTLKTTTERVGLICEGQKQMINMSLKELKGYLISTRFLGKDWGIPSVQLESEESLKNFFCGAWHLLFPIDNQVIVVGNDKNSVQMAYFTNPFKGQRISQKLLLSAVTANQQPVWSYPIKPGETGNSLMNSVIWQLDSVQGRYDYYLHQNYARESNGKLRKLLIRPTCMQQSNRSQQVTNRQESSFFRNQPSPTTKTPSSTAQIDIVAVFAEKYNFQQQTVSSPISLNLGLDISQTKQKEIKQKEIKEGWTMLWDKDKTQRLLREQIKPDSKNSNNHPSVRLHYHYNEKLDCNTLDWSWESNLEHAPKMTLEKFDLVVNVNRVIDRDIRPHNCHRDDQVTKIIAHITRQWQPNGDYLLVILSDGISEQEMKQLNKNMLPRGNGKRQLLVLTSDFLPTNSQSVLSLPKLPSNTGDTVISMYDKDWVENFVKAIFNF